MLRSEPVLPAFLAAVEYVIAVNILRLCVSAATAAVKFKVSLFYEQWILVHSDFSTGVYGCLPENFVIHIQLNHLPQPGICKMIYRMLSSNYFGVISIKF